MTERINIFVAVGSHTASFSRLIDFILTYAALNESRLCFAIQAGYTTTELTVPSNVEYFDFEDNQSITTRIKNADVVVIHGGIGLVNECNRSHKTPIIFPRLVGLGEHRDPSQVTLARQMAASGLGFVCEELPIFDEFSSLVCLALNTPPPKVINNVPQIRKLLIDFLD